MPFIKQLSIFAKKTTVVVPSFTDDALHAGSQYSAFISGSSGRAWAWGINAQGQLGNNTIISQRTPVSVLGTTKTFCNITGGTINTIALDLYGRAWGWGVNNVGQLGNNAIISQLTPVSVLGTTKTFCQIAGGTCHTLALDKNGRAWAWGNNNQGQLGNNAIISQRTPVSVLGTTKTFCQVGGGNQSLHSLALDKNGRAWSWGLNNFGQLGNNAVISQLTPVSVLGTTKTFCQIAGGSSHTIALDKNGRAWVWGYNVSGQLGNNTIISQRTPVSVLGTTKTFCQIAGGFQHTLALDKNGRAWAWGLNGNGQLGNNAIISQLTPVSVVGATKTFCQIAGGSSHTIALDKNGKVWAWGGNSTGQLGDNSLLSQRTPVSVLGTTKTFCKIHAGSDSTLAIDKYGRAWGWGTTTQGQLGDNNADGIVRCTPISVLGTVKTFCQIEVSIADGQRTIALDKNGRAWGWGYNDLGQLGDNSGTQRNTPVSVQGAVKTFCQISAGNKHTHTIDKNGRIWSWGNNAFGNLGNNASGTGTCQCTPVAVAGALKTFCKISAGQQHTIAIDKNGRAWGWGYNPYGEVGDNSITNRSTPVAIGVRTYCQIKGGGFFSLAIDNTGRAWSWGLNSSGQLGINSTTSQRLPTSVLGAIKTFCIITTGQGFAMAIDKNGRAWGWGNNAQGQLGNNTIISQLTPVSVLGTTKTFCQIAGGGQHTVAIDKNGRVWAWGKRDSGVLGDGFTSCRLTPVAICNI